MGEFDLSLIREFRSRPAFYDRNSPLFKDKVFTAREWQLIANKLGYDVSLLKDRMLQLRNRYNLEKRRLEQLRDENPGKSVESPWPLYNQLHFLSEHIRTRRSYKRLLPLQDTMQMPTPPEEEHSYSDSEYSPNNLTGVDTFPNGLVTVKMEEGDASNTVNCDASGNNMGSEFPNNNHSQTMDSKQRSAVQPSLANVHHSSSEHHRHNEQQHEMQLPPTISIRRLDTMRESAAMTNYRQHHQTRQQHNNNNNSNIIPTTSNVVRKGGVYHNVASTGASAPTSNKMDIDLEICPKKPCLSVREQKYAAFGSFMSSSLLELPPQKALLLLEKFTSELVKVIIEKGDTEKSVGQ